MRLMGMRLRFRSLGLALLSVAAAGVLLQIGPAQASSKKARPVDGVCDEATGARRLREAAARLRPERRPARPARPLRGAGAAARASSSRTQEAVLALSEGQSEGRRARLRFLGANPNVRDRAASARGRAGSTTCSAATRPSWHTNLPHLRRDRLPRPLAGGRPAPPRPERDAQVRVPPRAGGGCLPASASPTAAQQRLSLDQNGELRIETALGLLRDARPVSYQQIGGRRVAVESRFALGRGGAYGFAVGAYDPRYPLVIDPGLLYSTYLGGSVWRPRRRHRARRRRQRLPDRGHGLGGLPDDRGRLRHDLQRRLRRRLRDEARRERRRPRLLHLPGRKRRRLRLRHRARRRRQRLPDRVHGLGRLPDDRGRLRHDLQRRPRRLRDEARRERRRPRLLQLPGRKRLGYHLDWRRASASRSTAPATPT